MLVLLVVVVVFLTSTISSTSCALDQLFLILGTDWQFFIRHCTEFKRCKVRHNLTDFAQLTCFVRSMIMDFNFSLSLHCMIMVMISSQEFSNCLFPLFATPDSNTISQEQWLSQMRTSTPRFLPRSPLSLELIDFTILVTISWEGQAAARAELVDLLEAIAFLICR